MHCVVHDNLLPSKIVQVRWLRPVYICALFIVISMAQDAAHLFIEFPDLL
jgi:hypothetical protein